jgi:Poly(ADP-ribose) polymerase catalytic domain
LSSRGIYFAAKSSYSDNFAFRPAKQSSKESWRERPDVWTGDRELLLTKLLVGNEIDFKPSQETKSFVAPPLMPGSKLRYDTVTGVTGQSKVWVVYENGRAYPEYLVRYYRIERGNAVSTETEAAKVQVSFTTERSFNTVQDLEADHNNCSQNDYHNQSDQRLKWSERRQINMVSSQLFNVVQGLVGKRNNSSDNDSQNQSGRKLKWFDRSQINMASSQSFNGVQGLLEKRNNSSDNDSQNQSGRKLKWFDRSQLNMASSQSFNVVQSLLANGNNSSRNDFNHQSDEEFKLSERSQINMDSSPSTDPWISNSFTLS